MECEICNHSYNQTKKRPTVLYPCFHTFCSKCIDNWSENTCPTCRIEIKDKNINWSILKVIPEEDPNKMKQQIELEKSLKEAERLDKTFDQIFNAKLKETKSKSNKLNDQVNKKYNEALKTIQSDRKKLNDKISSIEKELNEMLHEIQAHSGNKFNFKAVNKVLEEDELDTDQMREFNQELMVKINRLNTQLEDINSVDIENHHFFKQNETASTNTNFIGEIEKLAEKKTTASNQLKPAEPKKNALEILKEQRYLEIVDSFDEEIKLNPHNSEAYCGKGTVLFELHKLEEAISCFDKSIAINPNFDAYRGKGWILLKLKREKESLISFNKSLDIDPNDSNAHCGKGTALVASNKFNESLNSFNKSIELDKNKDIAYYGKASALYHLNRYTESLAFYDISLQMYPYSYDALVGKAATLIELKRYTESIEFADKAMQLHPSGDKAYCTKGEALYQMDRSKEALTCYEKAIELNPDNYENHRGKIVALRELKKDTEASRHLGQLPDNIQDDLIRQSLNNFFNKKIY